MTRSIAAVMLQRNRQTIGRSFNIKRYGYEGAKRLAEEERLRMLLAVEDGGPALRNPAALELHRKLNGDDIKVADEGGSR